VLRPAAAPEAPVVVAALDCSLWANMMYSRKKNWLSGNSMIITDSVWFGVAVACS
jgi:hypothetical protein